MENTTATKVLIVEDTPTNIKLVRDLLRYHGFQVLEASEGNSALALINKEKPDLILMDISLKGINGLSLTKQIKSNPSTSQIPIIALTAHAMKQHAEDARKAGCDGFITKPINTRAFPGQISQYLFQNI